MKRQPGCCSGRGAAGAQGGVLTSKALLWLRLQVGFFVLTQLAALFASADQFCSSGQARESMWRQAEAVFTTSVQNTKWWHVLAPSLPQLPPSPRRQPLCAHIQAPPNTCCISRALRRVG